MNNKYYEVPILNNEYWVYVCVGKDYKELAKKLEKHFEDRYDTNFNPDLSEYKRGRTLTKNGYNPYIFINLNNCKTKTSFYAVLAHEACHAVDEIFNIIGDNNRDELFAHSVSAIIRGVERLK